MTAQFRTGTPPRTNQTAVGNVEATPQPRGLTDVSSQHLALNAVALRALFPQSPPTHGDSPDNFYGSTNGSDAAAASEVA